MADLERSRRFYRDGLGFREVSSLATGGRPTAELLGFDDVDMRCVFLERDGTRIELMYFAEPACTNGDVPRPMNRRGITHFAARVDDLEATLQDLEAAGAEILRDTRISNPEFESDVVYVLDPDGVRIELIQAPGDPTAAIGVPF